MVARGPKLGQPVSQRLALESTGSRAQDDPMGMRTILVGAHNNIDQSW